MCDSGTDVGRGQRLPQGFNAVEAGMDGAVPVGVHVGIDAGSAQSYEDGRQRLGRKVDSRAAARAGHPARVRRGSGIDEIRLAHRARKRGRGDYSVEEQLCVSHCDARGAHGRTFVILFRKRDHPRDRTYRIVRFRRRDFRGKVRPSGQTSGAAYGRECRHALGRRIGIEEGGDALPAHGLERGLRARHVLLGRRLRQQPRVHFVGGVFEQARGFAAGVVPDLSADRVGSAGRDLGQRQRACVGQHRVSE